MSSSHDNVIIDLGSSFTKSGFCGEKYPQSIISSNILLKNQSGSNQDLKKKDVKVKEIINNTDKNQPNIINNNNINLNFANAKTNFRNGLIEDWDHIKNLLLHIFQNELKVSPDEFNILISEPPHNSRRNREKLYEIIFENFNAKSSYIATQSILSVFASGKTSGINVESGESNTHYLPVYEGYAIKQALISTNVGGRDINEYLIKILSEKGINLNFGDSNNKIASDIKEKLCYISQEYENDLQKFSKKDDAFLSEYMLPDQSVIKLGSEKFRCAEILFKPNLLGKGYSDGIHDNLNKVLLNLDLKKEDEDEEKIKKELFSNIILSGGTTLFKGLSERLIAETNKISGLNYCDVVAIPERRFSTWIGGSILSTISIFQSLWITKDDYEEFGNQIINQKIF